MELLLLICKDKLGIFAKPVPGDMQTRECH